MPKVMFSKTTPMIFFENTTREKSISVRNEKKANHHFIITY